MGALLIPPLGARKGDLRWTVSKVARDPLPLVGAGVGWELGLASPSRSWQRGGMSPHNYVTLFKALSYQLEEVSGHIGKTQAAVNVASKSASERLGP